MIAKGLCDGGQVSAPLEGMAREIRENLYRGVGRGSLVLFARLLQYSLFGFVVMDPEQDIPGDVGC